MNEIAKSAFMASSPTDTPVELYVLQQELEICSIPRKDIPCCTHALIKICLLTDSNPRFFSFTETDEEITLVLPTKDAQSFPECVNKSGKLWRAFTVSAGAIGAIIELSGVSKIAKSIISPLADSGISVFCISTYQSDFILVQDTDLTRATECLGKLFKIFDENHVKINGPKLGGVFVQPQLDSKCRAINNKLHYSNKDYYVTGIDSSNFGSITQTLLELMFFSKSSEEESADDSFDERFFHFSIIDGDISFIVDDDALSRFSSNTVYHSAKLEKWRIVKVGDAPLGFEESGIVAKIAEPLANAQISIYYVSTFDHDHALVPEEDIDNITHMLERRLKCFSPCCRHEDFDNEIEK